MIMYGFAVVNTATEISGVDMNGNQCFKESSVKIFTSRNEAIIAAKKHLEEEFDAYEEYLPEGQDENGRTLEELLSYLEQGEDICIQFPDFHILIEFFQKDMGRDIINTNDYIATKLWNRQDIEMELIERGFEGTEEQINEVENTGYLKALEDNYDQDWSVIDYAISEAKKRNPMLFNEKQDIENEEIER